MKYHDEEWGVPLYDDKKLFEFIILDAFQAGLSWSTILNKRENFRKAFDGFDARKIAEFDQNKIDALMNDAGIIRNKLKIEATIGNAKAFLKICKEEGSFSAYIWSFTKTPIDGKIKQARDIPVSNSFSDAMSKDLRKRGFKFVGSTICYAFMQAAGMINDHEESCFRKNQILKSH